MKAGLTNWVALTAPAFLESKGRPRVSSVQGLTSKTDGSAARTGGALWCCCVEWSGQKRMKHPKDPRA